MNLFINPSTYRGKTCIITKRFVCRMEVQEENFDPPTSRLDLEVRHVIKWEAAISLRLQASRLMMSIPRPVHLDHDILALGAVGDLLDQLHRTSDGLSSPRAFQVAATAIQSILDQELLEAGLQGVPTAARSLLLQNNDEDRATLANLPPVNAPGEDLPHTGAIMIFHHLAAVQHWAFQIYEKSSSTMPFVPCALSENMIKDRSDHKIFFDNANRIAEVFNRLFRGVEGDCKTLWSHHLSSAGRISHPARLAGDPHVFDGKGWVGSILASKEMLELGTPPPDHPLPDADTLLLCFKVHDPEARSRGKRLRQDRHRTDRSFCLDKDTVGAVALLMGDVTYKLSLHLTDVVPDLSYGPHQLISSRQLDERVLKLGLFFQFCCNYQSSLQQSSYDLFEVTDIHFCFRFPTDKASNYRKLVAFHCNHDLGTKRASALPFLLTSKGLLHYPDFLKHPDTYLANVNSSTGDFLDEITGCISEARKRVKTRTDKKPNQVSPGPQQQTRTDAQEIARIGMVRCFHAFISKTIFDFYLYHVRLSSPAPISQTKSGRGARIVRKSYLRKASGSSVS